MTRLRIINPYQLSKWRKVAYFLSIVVSILITPSDLISDVLVIIPLLLLYELSITFSKFVYRRKAVVKTDLAQN